MYNFIFYFIYRAKIKADGKILTRYTASLIVGIYLGTHIALLYSINRFILCYYWHISIARSNSHATSSNSMIYLILSILLILFSYRYFTEKRIEKLLTKYDQIDSFYTFKNILKFILLFIGPLLIAIFFVNKSVSYCN